MDPAKQRPHAMPKLLGLLAMSSQKPVDAIQLTAAARCVARNAAWHLFESATSDDLNALSTLSMGDVICIKTAMLLLLEVDMRLAQTLIQIQDDARRKCVVTPD